MSTEQMSSRERMLAAIRREGPDHVPLSLMISQGPYFKEPLFWYNQIERAERLLDLGLDPVIDIWLPDPQPHPDVAIKTWREHKGSEVLITKEYHTPAGVLRQTVHETEDWCSHRHAGWQPTTFGIENRNFCGVDLFDDYNVSRRTEPWVKSPEDLDKLRFIIRPPDGHLLEEWRMDAERAVELAQGYEVLTEARRTIVGDAFQWFCDIPWFTMQLYDDPGFVEEFLGIFQDWSIKLVELVLQVGVDVVQYRGWYEPPTFWGTEGWQKHIVPLIEEQTGMVHEGGRLHSYLLTEGHTPYAKILKDMGVDVLQGIDPRMLHGGDLHSIFDQLGDSKAFWGGVDVEHTLLSEDRDRIRTAVREAIEILGGNGGLVLSANLHRDVPHQSIMWMIEAWREYCNP